MSSEFGNKIRVSLFGESHGEAVGALITGIPAGVKLRSDELSSFIERRRGGKELVTGRKETDLPRFVSGVKDGITCGSPVCIIIENSDMRSTDYSGTENRPRPGHADYTAYIKYGGHADMRGGGHFSGRLTAPLCAAGGIALQILADREIYIGAHLLKVGTVSDESFPLFPGKELFGRIAQSDIPVINEKAAQDIKNVIEEARSEGDSLGAVIECAVTGLPAGLGEPMFDGVENRIARVLFGIPGVKGVDFGSGFDAAQKRGSENNDSFICEDGKIISPSNNCGGILGGITTGMPLVFRAAVKPTPSISKTQQTVDVTDMSSRLISVGGRHDACIGIRAVPAVEAAAALAVLDMIYEGV